MNRNYPYRGAASFERGDSEENSAELVHVFPDSSDSETGYDRLSDSDRIIGTPPNWANVHYFEHAERIRTFEAHDLEFIIDGRPSGSTDNNRFSIGGNAVNSTREANEIKYRLGAGVKFIRTDRGVILQCLTDSPVYVQCPQVAEIRGHAPNAVYELQKSAVSELMVFDHVYFENVLHERRNTQTFDLLYTHCFIRMSFVEGFGSAFPRREVSECNCWVEVQILYKLKMYEEMLKNRSSSPSTTDSSGST